MAGVATATTTTGATAAAGTEQKNRLSKAPSEVGAILRAALRSAIRRAPSASRGAVRRRDGGRRKGSAALRATDLHRLATGPCFLLRLASMDQFKNQSASSGFPGRNDGFDFEITNLQEARRVHDAEAESQFDVATVAPPEHWERLRRARLPTDRALTGRAIDWLLALPPKLRPHGLSDQFPRIINALAEVWDDPERCQAAFDSLLCDGRRRRKGFPSAVRGELAALRDWAQVF